MTASTHHHEALGRPAIRSEGKRKLGPGLTAPGRRGVGFSRSVTTLAGDVWDHRLLVKTLVVTGGDLGCMAAETLAGGAGRGVSHQAGAKGGARPPASG